MDFQSKSIKFHKLIVIFLLLHCMTIHGSELDQENKKPRLSPGDVRFAKARCQSQFTVSAEQKLSWSRNQYPDDYETHCYVKCLLRKLGLIDLIGRGFDLEKLYEVWGKFNADIVNACLNNFKLDENLDDRCLSYYSKWMNFHKECPVLAKFTFIEEGFEKELGSLFDELPISKEQGVSATAYCDSFSRENYSGSDTETNSRAVHLLTQYKCRLDCIFRHFYYFDAYGRLDESEILLSFDEAHYSSSKNEKLIKKCTHYANMKYDGTENCEMAYELWNCLWKSTNDFSKVYIHRDMISRQY